VIGWFAVLFTGAWPQVMSAFLVRVSNYQYRIWAYVTVVDNAYPVLGVAGLPWPRGETFSRPVGT